MHPNIHHYCNYERLSRLIGTKKVALYALNPCWPYATLFCSIMDLQLDMDAATALVFGLAKQEHLEHIRLKHDRIVCLTSSKELSSNALLDVGLAVPVYSTEEVKNWLLMLSIDSLFNVEGAGTL